MGRDGDAWRQVGRWQPFTSSWRARLTSAFARPRPRGHNPRGSHSEDNGTGPPLSPRTTVSGGSRSMSQGLLLGVSDQLWPADGIDRTDQTVASVWRLSRSVGAAGTPARRSTAPRPRPLRLVYAPRPRTRPRDLRRLVQREASAPLTEAQEQRADAAASAAAGPRAVQSAVFSRVGSQVTQPRRTPGRATLCPSRGRSPCLMLS